MTRPQTLESKNKIIPLDKKVKPLFGGKGATNFRQVAFELITLHGKAGATKIQAELTKLLEK